MDFITANGLDRHSYLSQKCVFDVAQSLGMSPTAYHGMADGKVLSDSILRDLAAQKQKTVPQILLRWIVQQGIIALSKTVSEARAVENAAIFDFELAADDMAATHGLAKAHGRLVSPQRLAPKWDACV